MFRQTTDLLGSNKHQVKMEPVQSVWEEDRQDGTLASGKSLLKIKGDINTFHYI